MSDIVVFEDNPLDADIVCAIASRCGRAARVFRDDSPIRLGLIQDTDRTIVLDILLDRSDAFGALEALAASRYAGEIILMSGQREDYLSLAESVGRSIGLQVRAALRKPVDFGTMEMLLSA